jgi:hypothetical protein
MLFRGRHHTALADGGPCCWVISGTSQMCEAHERAIGEAAQRQAQPLHIEHATQIYGVASDTPGIDWIRPDSATPRRIEDQGTDR